MASRTKPKSIRDEFPNHPRDHGQKCVRQRSGNKVRWETFATREEAVICSMWAMTEAEIKYRQGYDAGYQSPGNIAETKDGFFEVCIL